MADCSDLEAQLRKAEERLEATRQLRKAVEAQDELDRAAGDKPAFRTFSMYDGTKIRINPKEFQAQIEKDFIEMGEESVKKLVRDRFDKDVRPDGSKGLNINYARMDVNNENVNALQTLADVKLSETEAGKNLQAKFTESAARDALLEQIALRGGNVEEIARDLARDNKVIGRLPRQMALVAKMKLDSTQYYADLLMDVADQMDTVGVGPLREREVLRAGQWHHYFDQQDALYARKIGQALNTRQFSNLWKETEMNLNFDDIELLDIDKIKPGSLASQVLDAIESGDAEELRKIARAKRVLATVDGRINELNFFTELRILNDLRKDNFFLSPNSWLTRNVVAGAGVNFYTGVEDFFTYSFYTGSLKEAYDASMFAANRTYMGMSSAFNNAFQLMNNGKPTFTRAGMKEDIDPRSLQNIEQSTKDMSKDIVRRLNQVWEQNFFDAVPSTFLGAMNLMNLGVRLGLGWVIREGTGWAPFLATEGSTMGYRPAFYLLGAGDEINKKMAFDWKVGGDAYIQALDEFKAFDVKDQPLNKKQWIANRANELADAAVYRGAMTNDELVSLRRRLGADQQGDMSNEAMRLKIMNELNEQPRPDNPLGAAGIERMQQNTFTEPLTGSIPGGIEQLRRNPLIGYQIPVFTTTWNGTKFLFDKEPIQRTVKLLLAEQQNAQYKKTGARTKATDFDIAVARGKSVTAFGLAAIVYQAWQQGIFTDGGSFIPDQNKRDRSKGVIPYAFNFAWGTQPGSRLNVPTKSIDVFSLMGLQADISRAFHEGLIPSKSYDRFMDGIIRAYARAMTAQETLSGVINLMQGITRSGMGEDVNWARMTADQFSGIMPLSGGLLWGSRAGQDPNLIEDNGRREMTPTEVQALAEDPNYNIFEQFLAEVTRNYPILGSRNYKARQKDQWGQQITRPLSVPYDATAPFAPVLTDDSPLNQWFKKHGFGAPIHPQGKVTNRYLGLVGKSTTMSIDEETTWVEGFRTIVGEQPAAAVIGNKAVISTLHPFDPRIGNVYSIDEFVQGNTVSEAMTLLSQDPRYELDLNSPNSPSLAASKDRPFSEQTLDARKSRDPRGVYDVYNAIVEYYDKQAVIEMASQHPEYVQKAEANAQEELNQLLEDEAAAPLGLSRQ